LVLRANFGDALQVRDDAGPLSGQSAGFTPAKRCLIILSAGVAANLIRAAGSFLL